MNENIQTLRLPTSCITSDNTPCSFRRDIAPLQSNNKDTIQSTLFYMLGSIDTIITEAIKYIEKGLPFYLKLSFEVKNASKTMTLNISNDALNTNDIIILGGLQVGIGVGVELVMGTLVGAGAISGGWALVCGISAAMLISYFLTDIYFYLKDKALSLWEQLKSNFDEATKAIASLVEQNRDSLQNFSSNLIDKISSWIDEFSVELQYNSAHPYANPQRNLESNDYQSLIELLLNKNSNALDIDTLLHTFPNYLAYPTHSYSTKDSTNSSLALSTPKDALPIHIKAQCFNHKKEALSNREIYVYSPNFYSFVDRAKSDENGFIEFHNAYVSSKMTNSDLYFVLNRYGLDEEQKDFHIKISPSKTIQPKDKQVGELLEQRLSFEKNIPKAITLNDNIKPNIKVISIECKDIKYTHNNANTQVKAKSNTPHNITMNNTSIKSHHTNNTIESITLQAHYVLKDSHKKNIQGDEQSLLKESIQRYKHKTKWGYIVFDRDEEIEQTLKQVNKTQPLIYSKRFKELENIKGEIVNIPFKEEWENKQIRFFAYLWRAHKDVGVDVEFEESIPPNVIRIETEDDSGEYIEIEFDENDTLKDINNNDELNDLLHQAKDILYELSPFSSAELAYNNFTAGEYKEALLNAITILPMAKAFKAKTIANKIKNIISKDKRKEDVRIHPNTNKNSNTNAGKKIKSKYATKQEVINVIENKYGLKTSNQLNKAGHKEFKNTKNVYWARDSKQIREIWDDITEGAEELQDIEKDKLGGSIKRRKLSDGTIIKLRQKSKSGGSAIEIEKESTDQIKIHSIKDKK